VKRSRLLTVAGAALAVGITALATTGVANAAPDPSVEYVNTPAQVTTTQTPFDATTAGWNVFNTSPTTLTFGPGGVALEGTTPLVLAHPISTPATSLTDLVDSAQLVTTTGSAYLGWALSDPNGGQYYVISDDPGSTFTNTSLFSLESYGTANNTGLTPDLNYSLAQLQTAFNGDTGAVFDAYGITNFPFTTAAVPAASTVAAIEFNDVTTYFTPTPTPLTITPTTTTVSGFIAGVTVHGTGFFPGETVSTGYGTGQSGNSLPTTFVADANGAVDGTLPGPANATAGTYSLVLIGQTSGVIESGDLTVTADPGTPTTPAVPSTPATTTAPVATPVSATATFTG
jgi:hypothetical protein